MRDLPFSDEVQERIQIQDPSFLILSPGLRMGDDNRNEQSWRCMNYGARAAA